MPYEKTGYQLAIILFGIHTHGGMCKPDEIVYREKDIIRMLTELGYPEPDFKQLGKINQFWEGKRPEVFKDNKNVKTGGDDDT